MRGHGGGFHWWANRAERRQGLRAYVIPTWKRYR